MLEDASKEWENIYGAWLSRTTMQMIKLDQNLILIVSLFEISLCPMPIRSGTHQNISEKGTTV